MHQEYFSQEMFYQHRLAKPAGAGGTSVSLGVCQIVELRVLKNGRLSLSFTVPRNEAWKGFALVKHYSRRADDPTGTIYTCERTGESALTSLLDMGCRVLAESVNSRHAIKVVGHDLSGGGILLEEIAVSRFFASIPFSPRSPDLPDTTTCLPPQKWSKEHLELELQARGLPPLSHKEAAIAVLKSIVVSDLIEKSITTGSGSAQTLPSFQTSAAHAKDELEALMLASYSNVSYSSSVPPSPAAASSVAPTSSRINSLEASFSRASNSVSDVDHRPFPPVSNHPDTENPRTSRNSRNSRPHLDSTSSLVARSFSRPHSGFLAPPKAPVSTDQEQVQLPPSSGRSSFKTRLLSFGGRILKPTPPPSQASSQAGDSEYLETRSQRSDSIRLRKEGVDQEEEMASEFESDEYSKRQLYLLRSSCPATSSRSSRTLEPKLSTLGSRRESEKCTLLSRTSSACYEDGEHGCPSFERVSGGNRLHPFRRRSSHIDSHAADQAIHAGVLQPDVYRVFMEEANNAAHQYPERSSCPTSRNILNNKHSSSSGVGHSFATCNALGQSFSGRSSHSTPLNTKVSGVSLLSLTPNSAASLTSVSARSSHIIPVPTGPPSTCSVQDLLGDKDAPRFLRTTHSSSSFARR
eukprot:gene3955-14034_t